ncbi:MAG TPA: peptidoglycan-associated lipoprotein Pal [Rhodocyclaceae bacterium]|nr:peptidoglycan-associated lipoprotein Pal [Rhodocyclaceae bacterium]
MRRLLSILALSLLAACSSQPPAPEQSAAGVDSRTGHDVVSAVGQYSPQNLKNPSSILSKREIFFDLDSYAIRDEFKPVLEAHAKFLQANPSYKMLIQGNTDERGSREYNLALGQKRAEAVKKALQLLGASESQIEAVSLGKEKPRCTDANEDCWAQNRRADILYTGEF